MEVPREIDDLFDDVKRQRLYASCGEGYLVVLRQSDADRYEVVEKVATVKQVRTCLFDAATGRLFLAVPCQQGMPGPEIRIDKVWD